MKGFEVMKDQMKGLDEKMKGFEVMKDQLK